MQERARFATPLAFLFFFFLLFKHLWKECSDKFNTHSCGDLLAGLWDGTRLLCADTKPNPSCVSRSHLSSLVLKPHLHHPNAESRLCGQRLPHLKPSRQKISGIARGKLHSTLKYFAPWTDLPHFPNGTLPLWFYWTLNKCSGLFGPLGYCLFKALARVQRRQFSYLSMTFGAGGLRYTSLPQLTQNRMLLATSKLRSEVGEIFLIWEFYL